VDVFAINGREFLILLVVAVLVIGPDRMPEYAAKLARLVKQVRTLAETARVQLREQMGPDFDDVDWKQYEPRQYDPRRIVREALLDVGSDDGRPVTSRLAVSRRPRQSSAITRTGPRRMTRTPPKVQHRSSARRAGESIGRRESVRVGARRGHGSESRGRGRSLAGQPPRGCWVH
jgi:sec-independent protein translocase protein TatB